jgi:hypothetical protein
MEERIKSLQNQLKDTKYDMEQPDPEAAAAINLAENSQRETMNQAYNCFYSMKNAVTLHKNALTAMDTNECPVHKGLFCSTDRSSYRQQLVQLITDSTASALEAQKNYQHAKASLATLEKQKAEQEQKIRIWKEKCALESQIKNLSDSMPDEPSAPQPIPDATGLKEELQRLNELLPKINLYKESLKAQSRYEQALDQLHLYDRLVKMTNPKNGILISIIMEQVLSPFESHCNTVAKAIFKDSEIHFQIGEKGMEVLYKPHGSKNFLMPESLSSGEKMQLTFILMDLVSMISASRILVFDNLEALDNDAIGHLLSIFENPAIKGRYDHIIFSVVNHKSIIEKVQTINGLQMIDVNANR